MRSEPTPLWQWVAVAVTVQLVAMALMVMCVIGYVCLRKFKQRHHGMILLFLRAFTGRCFNGHLTDQDFKVRDAERDRLWVNSILESVNKALAEAENEQSDLRRRVDDALARAAVTLGNGTDEYLARDALDTHHQNLLGIEISIGEHRLNQLADTIAHFRCLRTAILTKLPGHGPQFQDENARS